MPQKVRRGGGIGVIGVDAVVLCDGVNHIVDATAGNEKLVYIKRLCVDLAVYRKASQFRKVDRLHISRRQHCLLQVRVRPVIAVICS